MQYRKICTYLWIENDIISIEYLWQGGLILIVQFHECHNVLKIFR